MQNGWEILKTLRALVSCQLVSRFEKVNESMNFADLHLKRPLVFFDLETTGTKVGEDRIVEMAMVKLMPDGSVIKKPEHPGKEHRILVNPEMPIPLESSLILGSTTTM